MMPIGVPRVPYRTPREGGWQWVDIWNCLVRRPRMQLCLRSVSSNLQSMLAGHISGALQQVQCGLRRPVLPPLVPRHMAASQASSIPSDVLL